MTKSKLWHAFLVLGGLLAVMAPDLANAAQVLSGIEAPWLRWPIRILGAASLIGSRWDKIRAKLAPVLEPTEDVANPGKLGPPSPHTPVVK